MSRRKQSNPKPLKREDVWCVREDEEEEEEDERKCTSEAKDSHPYSPNNEAQERISEPKCFTDVLTNSNSAANTQAITVKREAEDDNTDEDRKPDLKHVQHRRLNFNSIEDAVKQQQPLADATGAGMIYGDEEMGHEDEHLHRQRHQQQLRETKPDVECPEEELKSPTSTGNRDHCDLNNKIPRLYYSSDSRGCLRLDENGRIISKQGSGLRCSSCGIRFSNQTTLEAHQTYYCSRTLVQDSDDQSSTGLDMVTETCSNGEWSSRHSQSSGITHEVSRELANDLAETGRRMVTTASRSSVNHSKTFSCPHCPFITNKKQIFFQHSSLHPENVQSRVIGSSSVAVPPSARYCSNCDIQFSSAKTYHVHKQYYCSTRHVLKPINSAPTVPTSNKPTAASVAHVNGAQIGASKDGNVISNHGGGEETNAHRANENSMMMTPQVLTFPSASPVILVPYPYIPGSNVGVLPGSTAGLLVPNGNLNANGAAAGFIPTFTILAPHQSPNGQPSLMPVTALACPTSAQMPKTAHRRNSVTNKAEIAGGNIGTCLIRSSSSPSLPEAAAPTNHDIKNEQPLDLSVKKGPKTEISNSPITSEKSEESPPPSDILPSHEAITPSNSPSPVYTNANGKRTSAVFISPVLDNCSQNLQTSSRISCPILPLSGGASAKQGTNKCVDCGVVFYKKENYLVHRRHYCAARSHKSADDGSSAASSPQPLPPPPRRRKMNRISSNSNDEFEEACSDHDTLDEANNVKKMEEDAAFETTSKTSSPSPTSRSFSSKSSNHIGGGLGALLSTPIEPTPFDISAKNLASHNQFICSYCNIRFTSLSTLQAHQAYYCLKRTNEKQPVCSPTHTSKAQSVPAASKAMGSSNNNNSAATELNVVRCGRCLTSFQLAISCHENEQLASILSNLRCPFCEASSPNTITSTNFSKNNNAGRAYEAQWVSNSHSTGSGGSTRSLRCTICGYRGNTLRGMKTHIRMHLDRGVEAQEESFISCVVPNGDLQIATPARNATTSPSSTHDSVDCDGPKSSNVSETCPGESNKCAERLANVMNASANTPQHACDYCGYTSSYKGNVVRHVRLVHKDINLNPTGAKFVESDRSSLLNGQSTDNCPDDDDTSSAADDHAHTSTYRLSKSSPSRLSIVGTASGEDSADASQMNDLGDSPEESNEGESVTVKTEPMEVIEETAPTVRDKTPIPATAAATASTANVAPGVTVANSNSADNAGVASVRRSGPKYCKSCDISFTYLSTFIAHKKFYCASHASENLSRETPVQ